MAIVLASFAVAALAVSASGGNHASAADPTAVYTYPAAANLFIGAGPLVLADQAQGMPGGLGLGAFQVRVTYNHQLVTLNVSEGPFLTSTGRSSACVSYPLVGQTTFGCVSVAGPAGPSGSGTIANVTVEPVSTLNIRPVPGNVAEIIIHNVPSGTVLADTLGTPYPISLFGDTKLFLRPLESDVTKDCSVDNDDMNEVIARYGATTGSALYNSFYDLEPAVAPDGDIDILDIQSVSARVGSTCDAPYPPQNPPLPNCVDQDADSICDNIDPDDDNDGLPDEFELAFNCLNPLSPDGTADFDSDTLSSAAEFSLQTNPCVADTDGDSLGDGIEAAHTCLDPRVADAALDADADGLSTLEDFASSTNPCDDDTDDDDLHDGAEVIAAGTDPLEPDTDGDGLNDGAEVNEAGTDPLNVDSDGDDLDDGAEVNSFVTDPLDADTDDDTVDDGDEVNSLLTDPLEADTDGDELDDGEEVHSTLTDPLDADTDDDDLADGAEVNVAGTDPQDADTDDDDLIDGTEVHALGTNPLDGDTDSDGLPDGTEVHTHGTSPLLVDTEPDGMPDVYEVNRAACGLLPATDDAAADVDSDILQNLSEFEMGTDPCDSDTDGDNCADGREAQTAPGSEASGGLRDALNAWDFFNPTHDGKNRLDDVLKVTGQYFIDAGEPGYTVDADRTYSGPHPWSLGPPDGKQRMDDVLAMIRHYFLDCA